jgi:hypothetical protein
MKLPAIANLRVPILVAMLCVEIGGLAHFYNSGFFVRILLYFLAGNLATAAVLWSSELDKRSVTGTQLALLLILLAPGGHGWTGSGWVSMVFATVPIVLVPLLIWIRLHESAHPKTGEPFKSRPQPERFLASESPVLALVVSVFVCGEAADTVVKSGISVAWSFPFLFTPILLAWNYVIYRIELRAINPTNNLSIVNRND